MWWDSIIVASWIGDLSIFFSINQHWRGVILFLSRFPLMSWSDEGIKPTRRESRLARKCLRETASYVRQFGEPPGHLAENRQTRESARFCLQWVVLHLWRRHASKSASTFYNRAVLNQRAKWLAFSFSLLSPIYFRSPHLSLTVYSKFACKEQSNGSSRIDSTFKFSLKKNIDTYILYFIIYRFFVLQNGVQLSLKLIDVDDTNITLV